MEKAIMSSSATPQLFMNDRKTAAIVVIGDEILKGQTLDTNSHVICQTLHGLGMRVEQIVVVPDRVETIAEHVHRLAATEDYVVTSGGVGPTHDDVTFAGVALAFDLPLIRHPTLVALIEAHFAIRSGAQERNTHPALKMAEVPDTSEVHVHSNSAAGMTTAAFPLVSVRNVFVLPGIPTYMERSLRCLADLLRAKGLLSVARPPHQRSVYVALDEVSITDALNAVVARFSAGGMVTFGSYPSVTNNYFRVHITVESSSEERAIEAEKCLREALPQDAALVDGYDPDPVVDTDRKIYTALTSPMQGTIDLLEECLTRKFKPSEVCISFNGGKDCTAVLHLYHAVLQRHCPDHPAIRAVYFRCENPFPEVETFIKHTVDRYGLRLHSVRGTIREGLSEFLASESDVKAIVMGNRRTDPCSSELQPFQVTDPSWPQVMRVFPILDWKYKDLWRFIRQFSVPYCPLYDQGYTSLGSVHNTTRNPRLAYTNSRGATTYHPAYKLPDSSEERNGRH